MHGIARTLIRRLVPPTLLGAGQGLFSTRIKYGGSATKSASGGMAVNFESFAKNVAAE